MSSTNAPFGLRPVYHPSGTIRPVAYSIAASYTGTAIYMGSPVKIHTDGTLRIAAAGESIIGAFQGCEYTDSSGRRRVMPYWTGESGATDIIGYATFDPATVYEIQADGPIDTTEIGQQADFTSIGTGSTITGQSSATIANATATAQATLSVIGIPAYPDNVSGDAYTVVQVLINEHQFRTPQAGF
ncbi:MAG TPA: hypothetical protein PL048_10130 [Leptospiraceae bacterium]|nr:hypothetical protein [Leptospiraceae bacterium]